MTWPSKETCRWGACAHSSQNAAQHAAPNCVSSNAAFGADPVLSVLLPMACACMHTDVHTDCCQSVCAVAPQVEVNNTQKYSFDRGHSLWRRLLLPHGDMQLSVLTRLTLDSQHKVGPCCKCARLALAQQAALLGPLGVLQLLHNLTHAGWLVCSRCNNCTT